MSSLDKMDTAVAGVIESLQDFATQHGTEVYQIAISAYTLEGVANLVEGFAAILLIPVFSFLCLKMGLGVVKLIDQRTELIKSYEDSNNSTVWDDYRITRDKTDNRIGMFTGFTVVSFIGVIILTFHGPWEVFNVWNWYAIFNPEVAAAHKILGL